MKTLWFSTLSIALVFLLVSLVAPVATVQAAEESPGAAAFMAHKCNLCHSVAAADIAAKSTNEKTKGPDLSGHVSEHDFATLSAFLRKTGKIGDVQHKKEFKGTDEELQAILDWLGSLEAQG